MVRFGFDLDVSTEKSGWVVFVLGLVMLIVSLPDDEEPSRANTEDPVLFGEGPVNTVVGRTAGGFAKEQKLRNDMTLP